MAMYPPGDAKIKREITDNSRHTYSGGHVPDSLPHTQQPARLSHHPSASHPSAAYPPDGQQRQRGYENGHSLQGGYGLSNYPPSTPSQQRSYESHQTYIPGTEPLYVVSAASALEKRRNARASQACDQCRSSKAKCDEDKPCKSCRDRGLECKFRDPLPKATDKGQKEIMDSFQKEFTSLKDTMNAEFTKHDQTLASLQNVMKDILTKHHHDLENLMGRMNDGLTTLEDAFAGDPNGNYIKSDPGADRAYVTRRRDSFHEESGLGSQCYNEDVCDHFHASIKREPMHHMAEDDWETEPGPPVPPGQPAIPIHHTTPAGLLLGWPSIRNIVNKHMKSEGIRHPSEYPISVELERGVLNVYGRGEDSNPSRHHAKEIRDHERLDIANNSSETASAPPASDWYHLGRLGPGDQRVEYKGGFLSSYGKPDFSRPAVWECVKSFENHILNMHPIIDGKVLSEWVHHFLETLSPKSMQSKFHQSGSKLASFAVSKTRTGSIGSKRKRSSPEPAGFGATSKPRTWRSAGPERSIRNALILTILALGKICQHRDRIYDALHQVELVAFDKSLPRNDMPRSPSPPPSISSHSRSSVSAAASPREREREFQNTRTSASGRSIGTTKGGIYLKKNYEAIPGLEYFALATDILGNYTGAYNNMENVYALLFAGLYQGQLARPLESFAFIHQACEKLQVILHPSLNKFRKIKSKEVFTTNQKDTWQALAFWTCLQLESDLVAEMHLPQSTLLSYEEYMPLPNMKILNGCDQKVCDSYLAQLYLRKHLNSIHRTLYAPGKNEKETASEKLKPELDYIDFVSDAVSNMNRVIPQTFAFTDEDPPADHILAARLRAKYWGAEVITYRPIIHQILSWSDNMQGSQSSTNMQPESESRSRTTDNPSANFPKEIQPILIEYAKRGIKALIESTQAFHGLGEGRPIITNVFGTAHAQWGNLLVLSACFKDDVLSPQVDACLLQTLFTKTIEFLRQSSTATSSLGTNLRILEGIQRDLFPPKGVGAEMTESFSCTRT